MKIAGVDCGVSGAVALLNTADDSLEVFDLELLSDRSLDSGWLFQRLLEWEPSLLVTENTFRVPTLIRMTGEVTAIGKILEAEVLMPAVVSWKKKTTGQNSKDKKVSIAACLRLMPKSEPLLKKPRARTLSPDRAEAVLMAIYGRLLRDDLPESNKKTFSASSP